MNCVECSINGISKLALKCRNPSSSHAMVCSLAIGLNGEQKMQGQEDVAGWSISNL
jgi:hypothetical protein